MASLQMKAPTVDGSTNPGLKITEVTLTLTTSQATISSAADNSLVGGMIIGWRPASAATSTYQIYSLVLNADGSVTVTLIGNPSGNSATIIALVATVK